MGPPGWFRLMRAGVFASVCVVLSACGHDLMASRPAPVWAGWTALAGVTAVGYCLADRRRSAWWILLAVEVVQVCLHLWFTWSTPADLGSAARYPGMAMPGGVHQLASADMAMAGPHGGGTSMGMVGAHAFAGVLVALWLYAGERALWRALRRAAGLIAGSLLARTLRAFVLLTRVDLVADRRPAGARRGRSGDEAPPVAVLRHVLIRRGPPRADGVPAYVLM
ncbi:MAG: hypothetical protein JWR24_1826 [Actinoallomurus sp.]|nr:hypothetical protein [Actinoallomurus sp.]